MALLQNGAIAACDQKDGTEGDVKRERIVAKPGGK